MIKSKITVCLLALSMSACGGFGGGAANSNSANNGGASANSNSANTANSTNKTSNVAANSNANSNAAKSSAPAPQRVLFPKGETSTDETIVLAPGESKQFVVGAKKGQVFSLQSTVSDAKITLITKGKDKAANSEPGHFDTTLTADGDYIFQVTNPTKKEFKTTINIAIDMVAD